MKLAKRTNGKIEMVKPEEFIKCLDYDIEKDLKPVIDEGLKAERTIKCGDELATEPDHATRLKYLELIAKVGKLLKITVKQLPAQGDDPEAVRAQNELAMLDAKREAERVRLGNGQPN
jgi:hypothetical protein